MTEWHLYQHNTNEDVRYWVNTATISAKRSAYNDTERGHVVQIRSPRNIAQEPDVYAWPADRSIPSGLMPYDTFIKLYTRASDAA